MLRHWVDFTTIRFDSELTNAHNLFFGGFPMIRRCAQLVETVPLSQTVVTTVQRHWKLLLACLGIGTVVDLLREYLRAKLTDWGIAHLGGWFGRWLPSKPYIHLLFGRRHSIDNHGQVRH